MRTGIVGVLGVLAAVAACDGVNREPMEPALDAVAWAGSAHAGGFVTGSGHYTGQNGFLRTFTFEVRTQSDGSVHGTFQLTSHVQPPNRLHGTLTCLSIVGNEAWIGGVYDRATNPALIGTGFGFYVMDNGAGHGAAADLMRRHVRNQVPGEWCATMPDVSGSPYLYPIEAGNISIHD